ATEAQRAEIDKIRIRLLAKISGSNLIDRDRSWKARRKALKIIFSVPRTPGREASLAAYRRREGRGLERFATWSTLVEKYGPSFQDWPTELQDPESTAVAAFAVANTAKIAFHRWLQWVMEGQLAGPKQAAGRAGIALGVTRG